MALDVTPDSLVLLDEIGSATDPEEGGALGVALVDHFRAAGAFTLASTHLMALKIYGANTQGVLNASMGFDERRWSRHTSCSIGLPGKSAGLDIAARLGMPEDIMKRARASLSTQEHGAVAIHRESAQAAGRDARAEGGAEASSERRWRRARRRLRGSGRSAKRRS